MKNLFSGAGLALRTLAFLAILSAFLALPARAHVAATHPGSPELAPRSSVQWTDWTPMSHAGLIGEGTVGAVHATLAPFAGNPARVKSVTLEYAMIATDSNGYQRRVFNYGVENQSLQHSATYDGTYGAHFAINAGSGWFNAVSMYAGMCGGTQLSTFDGELDWGAPGEMVVGGSGHNAGLGFSTYHGSKTLPAALATLPEVPVTLAIAPICQFETWTGDTNWVSSGWLDGSQLDVLVRVGYVLK